MRSIWQRFRSTLCTWCTRTLSLCGTVRRHDQDSRDDRWKPPGEVPGNGADFGTLGCDWFGWSKDLSGSEGWIVISCSSYTRSFVLGFDLEMLPTPSYDACPMALIENIRAGLKVGIELCNSCNLRDPLSQDLTSKYFLLCHITRALRHLRYYTILIANLIRGGERAVALYRYIPSLQSQAHLIQEPYSLG